MSQPRAPAVCSGYGTVGLHMTQPGEELVRWLCPACRTQQARATKEA